MKILQGSKFRFVLAALLIAGLAFVGCSTDKASNLAGPDDASYQGTPPSSLEKKGGGNGGGSSSGYPQTVSKIIYFNANWQQYRSAVMKLPNGTQFFINSGYLSPPADHPFGQPITLTMRADLDPVSNEVIYTFGPHGCTFKPMATLTLDWSDLGNEVPILYYIDENGNYLQQNPSQVDPWNNKMYLYLEHFSRYAISAD